MSSTQPQNTLSNLEILSQWAAADDKHLDTTNLDDVCGWAAYKLKTQEGRLDTLQENCELYQIELMELQAKLRRNEAIIAGLREDNKKREEQLEEAQSITSDLQARIMELEKH